MAMPRDVGTDRNVAVILVLCVCQHSNKKHLMSTIAFTVQVYFPTMATTLEY